MLYLVTKNKRHQYGILNTDDLSVSWVNKDWLRNNLSRINNYVKLYTSEVLNIKVEGIDGFFDYKTLKMLNIQYIGEDLCVLTQSQNGIYQYFIWFKGYYHVIRTSFPYKMPYFSINNTQYPLQWASLCCFMYRLNKNTLIMKLYQSDIIISSNGVIRVDNRVSIEGMKETYKSFKTRMLLNT